MRIISNFVVLSMVALIIFCLASCTSQPKQMEPILSYEELAGMITVTHRKFITLRTGQICEVKDTKIVACERNTYRYAENKADLRQMDALAESEENKNED